MMQNRNKEEHSLPAGSNLGSRLYGRFEQHMLQWLLINHVHCHVRKHLAHHIACHNVGAPQADCWNKSERRSTTENCANTGSKASQNSKCCSNIIQMTKHAQGFHAWHAWKHVVTTTSMQDNCHVMKYANHSHDKEATQRHKVAGCCTMPSHAKSTCTSAQRGLFLIPNFEAARSQAQKSFNGSCETEWTRQNALAKETLNFQPL